MSAVTSRSISLQVTPAILLSIASPQNKRRQVLACDLSIDSDAGGSFEATVNVIFGRLRITDSGLFSSKSYFLATQGGEVELSFESCELGEHTGPIGLEVQHTVHRKVKRNCSFEITPAIKAKGWGVEAEVSLGKFAQAKDQEVEFVTNLTTSEHQLAAVAYRDGCRWDLQRPGVDGMIRNYLYGNIHLTAKFGIGAAGKAEGRLTYQPNGIDIYSQDGKVLPKAMTLGMFVLMIREGIFSIGALGRAKEVGIDLEITQNDQ